MYKFAANGSIIRIADNACIPLDAGNSDYAQYLAWVSLGNTPAPYVALTPQIVQMRQIRRVLFDAGHLGKMDTLINALPSPQKEHAQIEWAFAAMVDRHSQLILALQSSASLTNAQLDALFTTAATIP